MARWTLVVRFSLVNLDLDLDLDLGRSGHVAHRIPAGRRVNLSQALRCNGLAIFSWACEPAMAGRSRGAVLRRDIGQARVRYAPPFRSARAESALLVNWP